MHASVSRALTQLRLNPLITLIVMLAIGSAQAAPAGAAAPPQIHTLAGGGSCSGALTSGGACDDVVATKVPILEARSVSALPGGGFLYIDSGDDLIREVSPSGTVTTVAGNETTIDAPNGSLAIDSGLDDPVSVAALATGGFLITEFGDSAVRMVSPGSSATATITTIAGCVPSVPPGNGSPCNNGLSGPATQIELNYPADAQPTPGGGVLIADTYNNYIRLLSAAAPGATISTIAGGGACNDVTSDCDGLPAGSVELDHPDSVSALQDGSGGYLVAEYDGDAIREVSGMGTFSTVAGTPGEPGYGGDGGPATAAQLNHPEQVLSTSDGGFLIADTANEVVRQVSASGTISTIAGDGTATYAGDGGAATSASLFTPASVSPTTNGGILVADQDNGRIREVTLPPVLTFSLNPSPNGSDGWYVSPLTATVTSTEGATINCVLDPVAAPPAFGALPSGCPFQKPGSTISGNGTHTLYAAAKNSFGDQSLPTSVSVQIDVGAPQITCNTPAPSFPFASANAQVSATLSDSVSGPASELLTVSADTSSLGPQTVLVAGANNAGTNSVATCSYTVTPLIMSPAPATSAAFSAGPKYTTVERLVVNDVPVGAVVDVRCAGAGCPFSAHRSVTHQACAAKSCATARSRPQSVNLTTLFAHHRLAPGVTLTVSVTEPDAIGRLALFTVRAGKNPVAQHACLAPGSTVTRQTC